MSVIPFLLGFVALLFCVLTIGACSEGYKTGKPMNSIEELHAPLWAIVAALFWLVAK